MRPNGASTVVLAAKYDHVLLVLCCVEWNCSGACALKKIYADLLLSEIAASNIYATLYFDTASFELCISLLVYLVSICCASICVNQLGRLTEAMSCQRFARKFYL